MALGDTRRDLLRPRAITIHLAQSRKPRPSSGRGAAPAPAGAGGRSTIPELAALRASLAGGGGHAARQIGVASPLRSNAGLQSAYGAAIPHPAQGAPAIDPFALYTPADLSGYGNTLAQIQAPPPPPLHLAVPVDHPVARALLQPQPGMPSPDPYPQPVRPGTPQHRPSAATPQPNPLLARLLELLEKRHSSGRRATPGY